MPTENEPLLEDLESAVERLAETFAARSVRYAIIGGLATLLRGRPRFTQDVDILLDVPQLALPGLLEELARQGFTFDRDTVIREYVQEHMTSLAFGTVRIDWLKERLHCDASNRPAAASSRQSRMDWRIFLPSVFLPCLRSKLRGIERQCCAEVRPRWTIAAMIRGSIARGAPTHCDI